MHFKPVNLNVDKSQKVKEYFETRVDGKAENKFTGPSF